MKYFWIFLLSTVLLSSCKKNATTAEPVVSEVAQDSLVRAIHTQWKFTVPIANKAVSTKLSNWEEWRNFVNELTIVPNPSASNLAHKAANLVEKVILLHNNIPDLYNKPETKARINLLETNVQNLDMMLELEPLDTKEISTLLAKIQKNTQSLINQFEEFEIKANIPKEAGEENLTQPTDTIKRATLNALPQE